MAKFTPMEGAVDRLRKRIDAEERFTVKQRGQIAKLIEPGYRFEPKPLKRVRVGMSRLGGPPELPDASDWPTYRGWPMVFLGQLNLAELDAVAAHGLPRRGLLLFFTHFAPEGDGLWVRESRDEFAVRYVEPRDAAKRPVEWHRGLPEMYRFPAFRIPLEPHASLPDSDGERVARIGLDRDQRYIYSELDEGHPNRVLGRPRSCQWIVGATWAEVVNRRREPFSKRVRAAEKFRHLLSFSDGSIFPVLGHQRHYFGIKKTDLRAGRFAKAVYGAQGS
jgi:hypothetical protein